MRGTDINQTDADAIKIMRLIILSAVILLLTLYIAAILVVNNKSHDGYMHRCKQENTSEECNRFWRYF